jgi:MATE family multidrug resistance protein
MGVTDTIMAGNYNSTDLAAIAIGQSFWLPTLLFFAGFFTASTTLIAHAFGANHLEKIRHLVLQSLLWACLLLPIGIVFLNNTSPLIGLLSLEPALATLSSDYLKALSFGLPGAGGFLIVRSLSEGLGKTRPAMIIQIATFAVNIPLNYIFIFGHWGAPELGSLGCGVATAITLWLQCICGLLLVNRHPLLRSIHVFKQRLQLIPEDFKKIAIIGIPIAVTFLAEVLLFSAIALIIAPLGTEVLAGHQIALSISALTFMLPLSVGMAITIRAGQQLGAKQQAGANFSCKVGLMILLMTSTTMMTLILLLKGYVAGLYSNNESVVMMASSLLFFAAIYQIPDAIQICMASALRAYQDTRIPLIMVLVAYWLISVPVGYAITYGHLGSEAWGAKGMWMGLVCGLSIASILLGWRFYQLQRKPIEYLITHPVA